jgi:Uma2 family endonuclease
MAALPIKRYITSDEYLEKERIAKTKSEYFNGEIFAMSGASYAHNVIATNLLSELRNQLRGGPCRPVGSDMRVQIKETGLYTYPDVVVVCGEPKLANEQFDVLLNPRLIIEVLSPSTEAYDRGEKFAHYRTLDSLQEYVLVSQDRYRVERFVRQSGPHWLLTEATGPKSEILFESIGCRLPLSEIYEGVAIPTRPELRPSAD